MSKGVLAIIPARAGSKSIAFKNIQNFRGVPLLAHSILTAKSSGADYVLVSTESALIAEIALHYGAKVPFLRTPGLAGDFSRDREVMKECITNLLTYEIFKPQIVLWLRPTYPLRKSDFIRRSCNDFLENNDSCMAQSVRLAKETPFKMWKLDDTGYLNRIIGDFEDDAHNSPRQLLPQVFKGDGNIDLIRVGCLLDSCIHPTIRIKPIFSPQDDTTDIDYWDEFKQQDNSEKSRLFEIIDRERKSS
jgi:CMP-N-acetylneuraminic acid synthetase